MTEGLNRFSQPVEDNFITDPDSVHYGRVKNTDSIQEIAQGIHARYSKTLKNYEDKYGSATEEGIKNLRDDEQWEIDQEMARFVWENTPSDEKGLPGFRDLESAAKAARGGKDPISDGHARLAQLVKRSLELIEEGKK